MFKFASLLFKFVLNQIISIRLIFNNLGSHFINEAKNINLKEPYLLLYINLKNIG